MLFVFAKRRDEDQPWWDDDPGVRAKNLAVERALGRHMRSVLNLSNGDGPEDGRDPHMHPLLALLKYGGLSGLSALGVWLIYMGVTDWAPVTRKSLQVIELHAQETTRRMDRQEMVMERVVNLLRAQCVNAAKNNQERNDCLRAGQ